MNMGEFTAEEYSALTGLRAAQKLVARTARNAGWFTDPATGEPIKRNFGEAIALMHSELSEALEADRKGLMDDKLPHRDGREVELADCAIRELDTADARGDDVVAALIAVARLLQKFSLVEVRFALSMFHMLELADALGLDVAGSIIEKNRFNQQRPDHKLANRAQNGGKKY